MKTIISVLTLLALPAVVLSAQETDADQPDRSEVSVGAAGIAGGPGSSPGHVVVVRTSSNGVARAAVSANAGGGWSQPGGLNVQVVNPPDADAILQEVEETVRSSLSNASPEVRKAQDQALAQMRQSLKSQNRYGGSGYGLGISSRPGVISSYPRGGFPDNPALVVSRPMPANVRGEWQEDLRVMDKLLRDEFRRVGGGSSREAMGIRLWFDGQPHAFGSKPAYIEDHAVLFSYDVAFPLAGASKAAAGQAERKTDSAWERARSEVRSKVVTEVNGVTKVYEYSHSGGDPALAPAFDADKVEALVGGLVQVLAEAKNIRHLKSDEFVIVSIAGFDDAGNPLRLTLKASKADIDKLAEGKLKPEEFRGKVARNLG